MAEKKKVESKQEDTETPAKAGAVKNKSARKKTARKSSAKDSNLGKTQTKKKSAKKASAKKTAAKKVAGKKSASKKTAAPKKSASKKVAAKKSAANKKPISEVTVKTDLDSKSSVSEAVEFSKEQSPVKSVKPENDKSTAEAIQSSDNEKHPESTVESDQVGGVPQEPESLEAEKPDHMPAVAAALDRRRSRSRSVIPILLVLAVLIAGGAVSARYWPVTSESASASIDSFVSRISRGISDSLAAAREALGVEEGETDNLEQPVEEAVETVAVLSGVVDTGPVNAEPLTAELTTAENNVPKHAVENNPVSVTVEPPVLDITASENSVLHEVDTSTDTNVSEMAINPNETDIVTSTESDSIEQPTVETGAQVATDPTYTVPPRPVYYYPQPQIPVNGNIAVQPRTITPPWPYPGYGYAPMPYPAYYNPGVYYPPAMMSPPGQQPGVQATQ